jgi:hypothetical protein
MKIVEQDDVLHMIYTDISEISADLLSICDAYEGSLPKRIGFNLPMEFIRKTNPTHSLLKYKAKYVIAYKKGDIVTKKHELQHAKFYLDEAYRNQVITLWNSFSTSFQQKITGCLQKMKYPDNPRILLDEFQAYYFTEKPHFFGKPC